MNFLFQYKSNSIWSQFVSKGLFVDFEKWRKTLRQLHSIGEVASVIIMIGQS